MPVSQGDLELLDSDIAKGLLNSTIPARMAYVATDGTPRVLPTWFHWGGQELVMGTFIAAPHVRHPAARLKALRANPVVAISIDTDQFPPQVLQIRGRVSITEVDGVVEEYAKSAHRYLGDDAATSYLNQINKPGTRMARIALRPTWVGILDFQMRLPSPLGGILG